MSDTLIADSQFRLLVDSLPELVWISGRDRHCIYVNRQWLAFTGRTLAQELGNGWVEGIHPDDQQRCIDIFTEAFAAREAFSMECRLRRFDGEYRWILSTGRPWFSQDGEFAGYVGSATDDTERREAEAALRDSEERFRQLAENIDQVFWFSEVDRQQMLYVSPAFERIWGVSVRSLHDNPRLWVERIHPEDRAQVERVFTAWSRGDCADFEIEYRITGGGGKARWIHDRCTPIYNARGERVRLSGIAEDVSVRKQAAEERERLQHQLQQAQKMEAIGHLTGGIAHDFNNILGTIIGYTGLALTRFVPDRESKLARYLREVYSAGERARDLIAQMLAFSRGTGNESRPHRLEPLVEEAMKLLQSTLPSGIDLSIRLDGDTPPVMIDPVQLHQLVINLCINARDAVDSHGRIEIGVQRRSGVNLECASCHGQVQGEFVELAVSDSGKGIESDVGLRMFEPFFSTREPARRSGMGLSIVHGIVHELDGHIAVESIPGRGSTFRLLFPVLSPASDDGAGESVSDSLFAGERDNGHRILVVDDEASVAGFLGELLECRGYRVQVLNDSETVLQQLRDAPDACDLVVMDQTMPGITGVELARALLELRAELPIILCTGYSDEVDEARARALGIRGFLNKPLSARTLLEMIERLLAEDEPDRAPRD
jgi:PAS domain S-box-containing protein